MFFRKKYYFLGVRFTPGGKEYNYISDDRSIRIGEAVRVPANGEIKTAVVCRVGTYTAGTAPYPVKLTEKILGRANENSDGASAACDISLKKVALDYGYAFVVADAEYREYMKREAKKTGTRYAETYPVSRAGEVIKKTGRCKATKKGKWYVEEHLFAPDVYCCSECGRRYGRFEPFCPNCRAEMIKTKTDPLWIDEIEFFESFDD